MINTTQDQINTIPAFFSRFVWFGYSFCSRAETNGAEDFADFEPPCVTLRRRTRFGFAPGKNGKSGSGVLQMDNLQVLYSQYPECILEFDAWRSGTAFTKMSC